MKPNSLTAAAKAAVHAQRRSRLLEERPALLGARWVKDVCEGAARAGRRIEGGWPGTVPEARQRVLLELTRELEAEGLAALGHGELLAATSLAYERAKREWQLAAKAQPRTGASANGDEERKKF